VDPGVAVATPRAHAAWVRHCKAKLVELDRRPSTSVVPVVAVVVPRLQVMHRPARVMTVLAVLVGMEQQ
jgi:hypothetical protein